jgi:hypothetical protein
MNILICGDSFSSRTGNRGWPELLEQDYNVTNISQAGCSEYRILKQVESVDLSLFDAIIINHTSPFRVYIKEHPIHKDDTLHHSCDLIYKDVNEHRKHNVMQIAKDYFENIFDIDHAKDMYKLILEKIDRLTATIPTIHCSHLEWDDLYHFKNFIYFNDIWKNCCGQVNHYNSTGNEIVYSSIKDKLIKICIRT